MHFFIFVLFPHIVLSLQFLNTTCFFTNVSVPVMQLLVTKKNKRREMILVPNQRKGICLNTKRERKKVRTYKHTSIHSLTHTHILSTPHKFTFSLSLSVIRYIILLYYDSMFLFPFFRSYSFSVNPRLALMSSKLFEKGGLGKLGS